MQWGWHNRRRCCLDTTLFIIKHIVKTANWPLSFAEVLEFSYEFQILPFIRNKNSGCLLILHPFAHLSLQATMTPSVVVRFFGWALFNLIPHQRVFMVICLLLAVPYSLDTIPVLPFSTLTPSETPQLLSKCRLPYEGVTPTWFLNNPMSPQKGK